MAEGWPAVRTHAVDDTLDRLTAKVRGDDVRKRKSAVSELADLGTPDAWELVLERLSDAEPEVADRAQLELARIDGEEAIDALLGRDGLRAKNDLVRQRVIEALGRSLRTVAVDELLEAVGDREVEARRLGWWSVDRLVVSARLAADDRVDLVRAAEKAARRDANTAVRAAALIAHARLVPAEGVGLVEALTDRRPSVEVRAGACLALAAAVGSESALAERGLARLRGVAIGEDVPRAVRVAAMEAASTIARALASVEALGVLVKLLEQEPERRLKLFASARLRALTGTEFGTSARNWQRLVDGLGDDWRPAPEPDSGFGARGSAGDGSKASLAGLPLLSDRLAILIDMSGSMWTTRDDGNTLKTLVDRELRLFLEQLPDSVRFNLIPYATQPDPWEDHVVDATPRNVTRALEWFEGNRLSGRGAAWEAIELALEDPEVDTVVLLSDGAPTGGIHWDLKLIVPLLEERNRFRRVAFDSILTDPRDFLMRQWNRLAASSGGICTAVRFTAEGER
ncbi:MAG: hypothetical protein AAFZ65_09515 [Planctomycetota bacterium]